MTKTKRSSGASLVTTSIWSSPGVSLDPAPHKSRFSLDRFETGDTTSIAFSIRVRFTQDRAHSLNTACSLRASSAVDANTARLACDLLSTRRRGDTKVSSLFQTPRKSQHG